jgi:NAD(P)-dependent dehydrogenase (short-subunit alcohol dehydrogenase family)
MKSLRPGGLITMTDLTGTTAVVTGASRGFGRGIASALAAAGAQVVGVARTPSPDASVSAVTADAADADVVHDLMLKHRPSVLVLNAGAVPPLRPIDELTWTEFSRNWEVDTRHVFEWTRAVLSLPMAPGGIVVVMSSGAALGGSPVSGGYAGAKAAIRFISSYAAAETERRGLGLRFVTLLPQLTPATDLGAAGVAAYAARQGVDPVTFAARLAPVLTPEQVGRHVVALLDDPAPHRELAVSGRGAEPVG